MQPNQTEASVLVISHDIVGRRMAGPGIRYYNLARVLSREFPVVLAAPCTPDTELQEKNLRLVEYDLREWGSLAGLASAARTVVLNSYLVGEFPEVAACPSPVVVDGYDPLLAEWLEVSRDDPQTQTTYWQGEMIRLTRQYLAGDFYLCASERQRDWWLGLLEASGRINPWTVAEDVSLRSLVDVVPFGLPEYPPQRSRSVIKGVWAGIAPEDKVILWGGGLWPWLDPLTAIQAMVRVWQQRQDVRLVFPGTRHPNPNLGHLEKYAAAAQQAASETGLLGKAIFFGDWVPMEEWPDVLLESDLAITLHGADTLETRLAFRSRVLDYVWAGLPVVASQGDVLGEHIQQQSIGLIVPPQDADEVAEAMLTLLDTPRQAFEPQMAALRKQWSWTNAAQPLVQFCQRPRRAPDKTALGERLGNPYYRTEIERLEKLVLAYHRRRSVQLVDRLAGLLRLLRKDR